MALVAPMPSASVRTAASVNPGLFRSSFDPLRRSKRKSASHAPTAVLRVAAATDLITTSFQCPLPRLLHSWNETTARKLGPRGNADRLGRHAAVDPGPAR